MAKNSAFTRAAFAAGPSSSWADDDDLDVDPLPLVQSLPKVEEQEQSRAESPRSDVDRKYSNDYSERSQRIHGGHDDRGNRGGYRNERRGDRSGYGSERPKNPVPDHGPYQVFVGNLPFKAVEHDLVDFFGSPETITDVRVQRDPVTDRPKGFAYVEFRDRDALVEALKLDGEDFGGRAIRIDVAPDNRKSRQKDNSFYDKRSDRSRNDRRGREEPPLERPRISLLPRSTSTGTTEDKESKTKSIFGDAKPRDESAYWERKKQLDQERAAQSKQADTPKKSAPREPKASHEETEPRASGGRGGRGRGERTERAGGRGRGASNQPERSTSSKKEMAPKSKSIDAKAPKTTKLPAPAATKVKNVFELLGDDSDSD